MTKIVKYQEMTMIELFDWTIINTAIPIDILEKQLDNRFIKIDWCLINTNQIKKAKKQRFNELESFIFSLDENVRKKVIEKKDRLKSSQGKEMTLSYAQKFVSNLKI